IQPFDPDKKYTAADQLMTQVIPLRYVVYSDVQELVQHLIHGYGKVIKMDRVNSILVTDTSANIARIVEVIAMIDQPLEKIEPRIYQLKHAEAGSVAGKLKELVEAAKTEKSSQAVIASPRSVPGVIRAPVTTTTTSGGDSYADETQIVQGEVKFVSDERTNILIIFSKAANFDFFDNIIKVLDVPVDPAVITEVVNLEYAKAKEISGILNEFVGAAKATEKTKASGTGNAEGSKTVDEIIQRTIEPTGRDIAPETKSAIGRLSADTKIISDERSNSLLLMGRKSDIEALKTVIASLDVMLEQVMIEAVILSVGLNDSLQTGIQWVYQNVEEESEWIDTYKYDTNNVAVSSKTNVVAKNLSRAGFDAAGLASNMIGGALSYYGVFPALNVKALIRAAKTDGDARILSTPVVMTTDNTEATITVGEERPVVSSSINSSSDSYSARATYEYRTIGLTLTVTPNINPQGFVVMEIKQTADDILDTTQIDGNDVPIISKREISATVAVQDRSTIVLGGLVRKSTSQSATKIPILGDIPLIGWFFSSHNNTDNRSELVVLLTPYVLTNPEQAQREAERRLNASDAKNTEWPRGWSESPLANDEPEKDAKPESKGFLRSIFVPKDEGTDVAPEGIPVVIEE
ncbi:MAG: type II secretion system secretin GspD, partial [Verrucomicrobia bacterium]|nr:type II secretion system secretin GspD [Verrucomicrobiota bacterium]